MIAGRISKYYLKLTLETINKTISNNIRFISTKRIRRSNKIHCSKKSDICFIWRSLEYIEKKGLIKLDKDRGKFNPKQYKLPKNPLNIEEIMNTFVSGEN